MSPRPAPVAAEAPQPIRQELARIQILLLALGLVFAILVLSLGIPALGSVHGEYDNWGSYKSDTDQLVATIGLSGYTTISSSGDKTTTAFHNSNLKGARDFSDYGILFVGSLCVFHSAFSAFIFGMNLRFGKTSKGDQPFFVAILLPGFTLR